MFGQIDQLVLFEALFAQIVACFFAIKLLHALVKLVLLIQHLLLVAQH